MSEDRAVLAPGFRALDERERKILQLRFFDGLTQSQIAQQVGISQMHVSRLIRRSLEKIREEIASDEEPRRPPRSAARLKPKSSRRFASVYMSSESSTTAMRPPCRFADTTRQGPDLCVYPVLTPFAPG